VTCAPQLFTKFVYVVCSAPMLTTLLAADIGGLTGRLIALLN